MDSADQGPFLSLSSNMWERGGLPSAPHLSDRNTNACPLWHAEIKPNAAWMKIIVAAEAGAGGFRWGWDLVNRLGRRASSRSDPSLAARAG